MAGRLPIRRASLIVATLLCALSANAVPGSVAACVQPNTVDKQPDDQVASRWVDSIARRIASDSSLQTGAASGELVAELQRISCRQTDAQRWLPRTCAPLAGPNALIELRSAVVQDALRLPFVSQQARPGALSTEQRVLSAALAYAAQGGSVRVFLRHLLQLGDSTARSVDACATPDELLGRVRSLTAPIDRAALLLTLLDVELQQPSAANVDVEQMLTRLVERFGAAQPDTPLTVKQHAALKRLGTDWPRLGALLDAGTVASESPKLAASEVQPFEALSLLVASVNSALELVAGSKGTAPIPSAALTEMDSSFRALAAGELVPILRAALAVNKPPVPQLERVLELLERAERFLRAPNADARYRVLRSTALGLGSWADHLQADARIGAMAVDLASSNYRIAANLGLGYHDLNWGVEARGSTRTYQTMTETTFEDLDRYEGAAEFWLATTADSQLRFDGRLRLGAFIYDSNHFLQDAQYDETSAFGRGALLAGVRYESVAISTGVWLGAGVQHEIYDSLTFATLVSDRQQTTRGHFEGRAVGAAPLWPSVLVLRAELEGSLFSITRMQIVEALATGMASDARVRFTELDATGNLHLDLEALRFFGFVPGASVALDYLRREVDGDVQSTLAPVVQVGIHRYRY